MRVRDGINVEAKPSGTGCAECEASGGWWFHLRRCAECGHVGCCDSSPSQHATHHNRETGHPVIQSFEPGEDWFWDYRTRAIVAGPALAAPDAHPEEQAVPGPAERVPRDWQQRACTEAEPVAEPGSADLRRQVHGGRVGRVGKPV